MAINSETNILKELMGPYEKGVEKYLKEAGYNQAAEAHQQGVPQEHIAEQSGLKQKSPNQILQDISQLANMQVPKAGTNQGIIPALLQMVQGKGFNPFAPEKESLGYSTASSIYGTMQSAENQPLETQKLQGEIQKQPLDIEATRMDLLKKVMELTGINPLTGQKIADIEAETAGKKTAAEVRGRKEEEAKIKTEEFAQELGNYFEIGDLLPTSEGLKRFQTGFELFGKSIGQSDVVGAAAADLGKINKRIRVKLVRQAGDVGNLNLVEQEAAEQLLYNISDSTKLRALKKAYLIDLNSALTDKSKGKVQQLIAGWVEQPEFKQKYPEVYKKYNQNKNISQKENKQTKTTGFRVIGVR